MPAQVSPPPKPTQATRMPARSLPVSASSCRATGTLAALVGMIVCVMLMVAGIGNLQTAALRRGWGDRLWWLPLVTGVLCVLLGVYALLFPGASAVFVMRMVGVMMLISSAVNLINVLTWRE